MASQWPPKKNTAFTLYFTLYKNDGTVIANPGTYTKKISKDGGAVADITASVTEVDTTYGELSLVLSSTEMNADAVWVQIKDDTTGCVPFSATLYTAANLMDDIKTDTAAILSDTGTDGVVVASASKTGYSLADSTSDAVIADAVWNAATATYGSAGTYGQALEAVGAGADPWLTALPGAYGAGTAGKIIGDNINAPIATVDTVVDAIKVQTDKMAFTVANQIDANVLKVGGTTQTARDIGASVLLSPGTGAGQLDITSGVVKANMVQILASAIAGTAAQISAAFTKFFDKATPTGTINSLPDAVPDAAGGLPVTGTRLTALGDARLANLDAAVSTRLAPAGTLARVTLTDTCTTNTDLVTAASIKTAMEADGGDLSSIMEALVNKMIITEADGACEIFNDSGTSQGSVAACFTSVAGFTKRERLFK